MACKLCCVSIYELLYRTENVWVFGGHSKSEMSRKSSYNILLFHGLSPYVCVDCVISRGWEKK